MARGVNKVILVGNIGADPEMRQTAAGMAVANLSLATSEQWTDKSSGEKRENTEWHRVVMFGRLGEIAGQYLRKGSQIYVEGRLQTRKWQGQDGQDRYSTEIIANEMQMLGGRGGDSSPSDFAGRSGDFGASAPRSGGPSGGSGGGSGGNAGRGGAPGGYGNEESRSRPAPAADTFDDDVPF